MSQPALFHESITDALREVVMMLGGTKSVGARMRPELSPDHAGRWLADCLNEDRRERINPDQVLWLVREGRKVGAHGLISFLCSEGGYAVPVPVDPEDERAKLQREYVEAARNMAKMAERIERLQVRAVS